MSSLARNLRPASAGAVLALLTIGGAVLLPAPRQVDLFAVLLAAIGAVYVGFALADERTGPVVVEGIGALVFAVLALLGLWVHVGILAAGYVLHGLWDLVHPHPVPAPAPAGYAPLCAVYDWGVAAYVVFLLL